MDLTYQPSQETIDVHFGRRYKLTMTLMSLQVRASGTVGDQCHLTNLSSPPRGLSGDQRLRLLEGSFILLSPPKGLSGDQRLRLLEGPFILSSPPKGLSGDQRLRLLEGSLSYYRRPRGYPAINAFELTRPFSQTMLNCRPVSIRHKYLRMDKRAYIIIAAPDGLSGDQTSEGKQHSTIYPTGQQRCQRPPYRLFD